MEIEKLINRLNGNFKTNPLKQILNNINSRTLCETTLTKKDIMSYMKGPLTEPFIKLSLCDNEFYKMYLVRWGVNHSLPKHYHPQIRCLFKVIEGELKETTYKIQTNKVSYDRLTNNQVKYIDDTIGAHKVENINNDYTYSLHIYYDY